MIMYTTEDFLNAWYQTIQYKNDEDVFFDNLSIRSCELVLRPLAAAITDLMNQGEYRPHATLGIRVDKESGFRLKEIDNPVDAVVAQVLLNRTGQRLESEIPNVSYGYRLNTSIGSGTDVFVPWTDAYQSFLAARNAVRDYSPEHFYMITDLSNFYASININEMLSKLATVSLSESEYQLWSSFVFRTVLVDEESLQGEGLPQGPAWARVMANMYLASVDLRMEQSAVAYGRYVDDMFFLARSEGETGKLLNNLRREVEKLGLSINERKTIGPTSTSDPTPLLNMNLSILNDINASMKMPGSGTTTWAQILSEDYLHADDPDQLAIAYKNLNYVLYIVSKAGDDTNVDRVLDHLIYLIESSPQKEAWLKRIFKRWLSMTNGYVDGRLGDTVCNAPAYVQLLFNNELGRREELHSTAVDYLLKLLSGNPDALCSASALSALAHHRVQVPTDVLTRYILSSVPIVSANAITCAPGSYGPKWIAYVLRSLSGSVDEQVTSAALYALALQGKRDDGAAILRRVDLHTLQEPVTKLLYTYCSIRQHYEHGIQWIAGNWDLGMSTLDELMTLVLDEPEDVEWLLGRFAEVGGTVPDVLYPPNDHVDHLATFDGVVCYVDRNQDTVYEVFACSSTELDTIKTMLTQLRHADLVLPYSVTETGKSLATISYDLTGYETLYRALHRRKFSADQLTNAMRLLYKVSENIPLKSFDTFRIAVSSNDHFYLLSVVSVLRSEIYQGYDGERNHPVRRNLSLYGGYLLFECLTRKAIYINSAQHLSEDEDLRRHDWHVPVIVRKAVQVKPDYRYRSLQFLADDLQRASELQAVSDSWVRRFDAEMLWVQRFEFSPELAVWRKELGSFHDRLLQSLAGQSSELPRVLRKRFVTLPRSLKRSLGSYAELASRLSAWASTAEDLTGVEYPLSPTVIELYWIMASILYAIVLGYATGLKSRSTHSSAWVHVPHQTRPVTVVDERGWKFTLPSDVARAVLLALNYLHEDVQVSDVQRLSKLSVSGLMMFLTIMSSEQVEIRSRESGCVFVHGARLHADFMTQDYAKMVYRSLAIDKALRTRRFDVRTLEDIMELIEWAVQTWRDSFLASRLESKRSRGNDAVYVRRFGEIPQHQVANVPDSDVSQPYPKGTSVSVVRKKGVHLVLLPPTWSAASFISQPPSRLYEDAFVFFRASWKVQAVCFCLLMVFGTLILGWRGFVGSGVMAILGAWPFHKPGAPKRKTSADGSFGS